jgi:membrane-bound lytic murein transglycosylase D
VTGPWPILAADLHAAVVPAVAKSAPASTAAPVVRSPRSYKVRKGDTLVSIVRNLHCSSVQEVAELNDIKHHHLKVGRTIRLPACQ